MFRTYQKCIQPATQTCSLGGQVPSGKCLTELSHLLTNNGWPGMTALKKENGMDGDINAEETYIRKTQEDSRQEKKEKKKILS